jgi:hypothetical protein
VAKKMTWKKYVTCHNIINPMKNTLPILLIISLFACDAQDITNKDWQIKTALLAAPEELRAGAKVMGFDKDNKLVTLREGTNEMICLADEPTQDGFGAFAYHKDLEPYMARGRELRAQGKNFQQIFEAREKDAKEGKYTIPQGSVLYALTGTYDFEKDTLNDQYLRYVVYIPYATAESTGLPLKPMAPGAPWIMDPGTHRAHIMINPPKN